MNPRLPALDDAAAPADARPVLDQVRRALGTVPNLHRTLAVAPAALKAYAAQAGALSGGRLDPALREQVAVATAGRNECAYCASAHTMLGKGAGVDEEELARNLSCSSADPRTAAALAFVRTLLDTRGDVPDESLRTLRDAGFGDEEIVEIAAHVGMNWFTNVFNRLARTEIDFPVVELAARA